jgi:hypothetical protein
VPDRALTTFAGLFAAVALCGCRSAIEYGPADGEVAARYAYREQRASAGHYVLSMIGAANANPLDMQAMWDRRANELCGGEFEKKIFKAERATLKYGYYGGTPGPPVLEGFLDCKAAVPIIAPAAN